MSKTRFGGVTKKTRRVDPRKQFAKKWVFTCFDMASFKVPNEESELQFIVYNTEICPDTHREHYQGHCEFKKQVYGSWVQNFFGVPGLHIEVCRDPEGSIAYCMKGESRKPGTEPFTFGKPRSDSSKCGQRTDLLDAMALIEDCETYLEVEKHPDLQVVLAKYPEWVSSKFDLRLKGPPESELTYDQLYNWQKYMYDYIQGKPKRRDIQWIWSEAHATGKTTFFHFIHANMHGKVIEGHTDMREFMNLYRGQKVILFDLAKATIIDNRACETLEKLSNQTVHNSTKYRGGSKLVVAHILVVANVQPPSVLLSRVKSTCVDSFGPKDIRHYGMGVAQVAANVLPPNPTPHLVSHASAASGRAAAGGESNEMKMLMDLFERDEVVDERTHSFMPESY